MPRVAPLPPEGLRWVCDPGAFTFETTEDVAPLDTIIGQERALRAIEFSLGVENHGYNVYVLGEGGTGRTTSVKALLEKKAKDLPAPPDWCYVYNFADPDRPKTLRLPAGKGARFRGDMDELIGTLIREIPRVFEGKDYESHRDEIIEGQQERTKALFHRLEQTAQQKGFMLKKSVSGISVVAAKDGKPMGQDDFDRLPSDKRAEADRASKFLQDRLSDAIREARKIEKDAKDRIEALDREVVQYVVTPLMNELFEKYRDFEAAVQYLSEIKDDIFRNIDDFRAKEEVTLPFAGIKLPKSEPSFERYKVNLIVDNRDARGAPVVMETNPTYYNLFGRIEHKVQLGVAVTDFTMIKAGSIHRANGGYLVLNALDVLRNLFVYDALKRMIKTREVKIEDVWEQYRLLSTTALKPDPIPVDIKIVLIGEPYIYYLLYNVDDEYSKLFKVKADFDHQMERTGENVLKYARFVSARCKEEGLLPFDRGAVARVVEHGLRLTSDTEKLSARFNDIENLVVEASYWAGVDKSPSVMDVHVEKAERERVYRDSRIADRMRELIKKDVLMVETSGRTTGQVNGIAVLSLGDYSFGKPSRITAKTFMGDDGIVNIEREVKMSGRIHNKALMILTSFLGERYGQSSPLTFSASICFEQLYEEIEGDSATCTEVYALLSSLSGLPLDQGIAVTGSMNQRGEVQPVGGINEKIEGFFDVCVEKGLTGTQGVIIPSRNVKNLMLKKEVVEAVSNKMFAVYPISYVDQGMEILAGVDIGERDAGGNYPEGTINRLASERLRTLAESFKTFGKAKPEKKDKKEPGGEARPPQAG